MRINIRPSVPTDAPAIVELLAAAGLTPSVEPRELDWKYWQQRQDWAGARSFVASHDTRILAHAAVVPGICVTDSHRVTVLHLIDWAARADAAGVGISLMMHIARLADALLAVGGSNQARQILPHFGFRSCGTVQGYVRVLRPLRFSGAVGAAAWKLPMRLVRRCMWRLSYDVPVAEPAGWSVTRVALDEVAGLVDTLPRSSAGMAVFERSEGLFSHMLRCPIVPMELYALKSQDQVQGYFLLAFAPGQTRIVDCRVASDEPAAWHALLQFASLQARRQPGVGELVAWSSDPIMGRALVAGGFHRRNQQPILLRHVAGDAIMSMPLRVQMLENDTAYQNHRFTELWA